MTGKRWFRWGDLLIVVIILTLAVGSYFLTRPGGETARASVTVDGQTVKQVSLPSYETVMLDNSVVIRFDGMRACIEQSDCPDKTCVQRGWLTVAGQTSVCLPNRTVLTLDGGDIIIGG